MTLLTPERFLDIMEKTPRILERTLHGISQQQAETLTDGPDGWSVLIVVCHLHNYAEIFMERANFMIEHSGEHLPNYDHLALIEQNRYREQDMRRILAEFKERRAKLLAWFRERTAAEWNLGAKHDRFGYITLLDLAMHIGWHDINHIDQIAKSIK